MGPEQSNEIPNAPAEQPITPAKTKGLWERVAEFLKGATNVSQADALVGTTAGRVMPEATQAVAAEVSKTNTADVTSPVASGTK
jgi:hypothetical protein